MDLFLARLGQQVFNAAVRSGIAMTSNLVLKKCNQLITSTRGQNSNVMIELAQLQKQLDGRIGIVSHAVDLIQLRYIPSTWRYKLEHDADVFASENTDR